MRRSIGRRKFWKVKRISWKRLLKRRSLAKGEIEYQAMDTIVRGPIKCVEAKGDEVRFDLLWCASYDLGSEKWTLIDKAMPIIFRMSATRIAVGRRGGHLVLTCPGIIVANLFLWARYRLDPAEVDGLDLERLPGPKRIEPG